MRRTQAAAFVRRVSSLCLLTGLRNLPKMTALLLLLACGAWPAFANDATATVQSGLLLPLTFEPNRGQTPAEALYLARGAEGSVLLDRTGIVALLGSGADATALRIRFIGSASDSELMGENPTGGIANYYGRGKRLENIPFYSQVRFKDVYSGTDVVFHGRAGRLEYDFELAPHANPGNILIDVSEADSVSVQKDKSLLLTRDGKQLQMLAPEAFQEINGKRVAVEARYKLTGTRVAFELGSYDVTKPLIIDPVVAYTFVFNVNNSIFVHDAFADTAGNFYFAGETYSTNYPVTVGGSPTDTHPSAFITKLNPTGTTILVSTIIDFAIASAMTVDPSGNLYMAGGASPGFTATSGTIATCSDTCSGFVAKLNGTGQLTYATLLSTGGVSPHAITADSNGNAYLTGNASDGSLEAVNALQPGYQPSTCNGCSSPFFAKLNPSGTAYEFASYFGTSGTGQSIALDQSGNIYLAGNGAVPLLNPLQVDSGSIFVSKLTPDGKTLLFSTQFGGSGDTLVGMGLGSDGTVYLAGNTPSNNFPYTLNAYRLPTLPPEYASSYMFASAIKSDLTGLSYSTYLGQGVINDVNVGSNGGIFVAGSYHSEPLPLKNPVVSDNDSGAFVLSLDKTGIATNATQFGGASFDQVPDVIAADSNGDIYIAGRPRMSSSMSARAFTIDPVNIGTGDKYRAQQLYGSLHLSVGYATYVAKIANTNAPQISASLYSPAVVLRNAGSATLNVQSLTVGQEASKSTSCGSTLSGGASCIVAVPDYAPLTVNSNAQPTSQSFSPIPNYDQESVQLWPERGALYFGLQQRGNSGNTQSLRIWNVSTASVAINSVSTSGAVSQTNDCPANLAPSTFCTAQVSLVPDATATGGTLTIATPTKSISVPAQVYFTTQPIALSTRGIYFGVQVVGAPSLYRTVTLTNTSNSSVSISYSITGDSEFSTFGTTCGSTLGAHASCAVALMFTPAINGSRSAKLAITANESNTRVDLAGAGTMNSAIRVDPLGLTFANAIIGKTTYPQSVTLTNTSANPVNVTGIQFSSPHYVQTNTCESAIPPAGACKVDVSMQPQDVVNDTSTMTVTFDTAAEQVISVSGSSVFPIDISPAGLDFGNTTPVGVDSNPRWLYLGNGYSQGDEETNYSLSLTGDFKILENHCPNPLIKYQGCALVIVFHPEAPGTQEGALTVSIPGLPAKNVAPLYGTAASAGVKISPEALDFPETMDTTKSAAKIITLYNPQTFAVTIPAPTLSGEHFEFTNNCATIQPGASCDIPVVFSPSGAGFVSANLFFENGGTPPTTIRVGLTGVGYPAPGLSASTTHYSFNLVDAGTSSTPFGFKITNLGPKAVALPALSMTGTNAADFVATPDAACSSIPSDGSCNVQIVFSPKKSGPHSATLSLPSGGTNPYTIKLYLEGAGLDFAVSSSSGDQLSKSIASGQSANFSLRVQRQGYTGQIQVQCAANGASYGSCTANPSIVPASSENSDVSISIGTASVASAAQPKSSHWPYALAAMLPGLLLMFGQKSKIRAFALIAICFLGLSSCGGGGGGGTNPPPSQGSTYRYTVTFTGSASHTVNLSVTVK